jgi:hypothetical protein
MDRRSAENRIDIDFAWVDAGFPTRHESDICSFSMPSERDKVAKFLALVLMTVFPALIATKTAIERTSASAQPMEFPAAASEFRGDNRVVKQYLATNQSFCKFA